jgi:hypothetical protein
MDIDELKNPEGCFIRHRAWERVIHDRKVEDQHDLDLRLVVKFGLKTTHPGECKLLYQRVKGFLEIRWISRFACHLLRRIYQVPVLSRTGGLG